MKPRIKSWVWTVVHDGSSGRRWHVTFEDSCGCETEEDFESFSKALRFALYVANGGDRWGFA